LVVGAAGVVGGFGAGAAWVAVGAVGIEGLGVAAGTVIVGCVGIVCTGTVGCMGGKACC